MDLLPSATEECVKITKAFLQQCSEMKILPISLRAQLKKKSNEVEESRAAIESGISVRRSDVCQECGLKFDADNTKLFLRSSRLRKKVGQNRNNKIAKRLLLGIECVGCGYKSSNISSALPFKTLHQEAMHNEQDSEIDWFASRVSLSSSFAAATTPQVLSGNGGSVRSQAFSVRSFTPLSGLHSTTKPKQQRTDRVRKLRILAEQSKKTPEVADRSLSSFLASLAKVGPLHNIGIEMNIPYILGDDEEDVEVQEFEEYEVNDEDDGVDRRYSRQPGKWRQQNIINRFA
uniref:Uncharacterized protein n=1 Tax=Ditylenchus dipsaci TaxID=166011 RepID=A0A915CT68_9BILA